MDRFKFRTGFTISFYDIADNDVKRQIILDSCFSIDNGGEGICVNEGIIQEALDIYVAKDEHKSAWDFINANYAETDGYYFIDSVDFLEQCTGIKDKNDKLIYEGDIVKGKATIGEGGFEYLGCIKWCYQSELIGWHIEDKDGGAWELKQAHAKISADNITGEVIGNIHENADLLGEE